MKKAIASCLLAASMTAAMAAGGVHLQSAAETTGKTVATAQVEARHFRPARPPWLRQLWKSRSTTFTGTISWTVC